jgi:carboxyl-terminal processing protease
VYSQLLGRTLLVQVTQFGDDTSARSRTLLSDGLRSGATGVVLDLRHNPGGLVTAAQDLVSQFVAPAPPQREDVVVRRGRFGAGGDPASAETVAHDRLKPGGVATAPKLAVIVDSESASASEIVAAALKDYGRGQIVGQRTFGKGSVQVDFKLPDGNDLHLTVEKWFGPHGESIEETGVQPGQAITLAAPDARFRLDAESIPATQDTQLQAALAAVGRR